jgi:NADP-dependent 3-hydroxy acid dehydrogenase YdfG
MYNSDLLKDKVILITGGGTGLGKAMGERFLQLGAKLAISGRRVEVLQSAANELGKMEKYFTPAATFGTQHK